MEHEAGDIAFGGDPVHLCCHLCERDVVIAVVARVSMVKQVNNQQYGAAFAEFCDDLVAIGIDYTAIIHGSEDDPIVRAMDGIDVGYCGGVVALVMLTGRREAAMPLFLIVFIGDY